MAGYEDYLRALQRPESGGNPQAVNRETGAFGLYQIMPGTAEGLRRQGVNVDLSTPEGQAAAAAELTRQNDMLLRSRLGRDPTDAERYFAHGFGGPAAAYLLANPDRPLGQALREFYGGTRRGAEFADTIFRQNRNLQPLWEQPVSATVADFGTRLGGGRGAAAPRLAGAGAGRPAEPTVAGAKEGAPRISSADIIRLAAQPPGGSVITMTQSERGPMSDFGPLVAPTAGQQVAQAAAPTGGGIMWPWQTARPAAPAPTPTETPPVPAPTLAPPPPPAAPTREQILERERRRAETGQDQPPLSGGAMPAMPTILSPLFGGHPMAPPSPPAPTVTPGAPSAGGSVAVQYPPGQFTPFLPPGATPWTPVTPPPPPPTPPARPVEPTPPAITPPAAAAPMDYSAVLDAIQRATPAAPTPRSDRDIAIDMLLGGLRGAGGGVRPGETMGSVLGRFGAGAGEAGLRGREQERQQQDAYRNAVAEAAGRQAQLGLGIAGQQQQGALASQEAQQRHQQLQQQQYQTQMALYTALLRSRATAETAQARLQNQPLSRTAQEAALGTLRSQHLPAATAQAQRMPGFLTLSPSAQVQIINDIAMGMAMNTEEGVRAWRGLQSQMRAPYVGGSTQAEAE